MGPFGYLGADVHAGRDHDDDPVIFIEARYALSEVPIDSKVAFGLVGALRDALESYGESRFPHLRHHFDDRQQVAHPS